MEVSGKAREDTYFKRRGWGREGKTVPKNVGTGEKQG